MTLTQHKTEPHFESRAGVDRRSPATERELARAQLRAGRRDSRFRRVSVAMAPYLMTTPAVIGLVLFVLVPTVLSLIASFFTIPLGGGSWTWVGFGNFVTVLSDEVVQRSILNTLLYTAGTIIPSLMIGFSLALLANTVTRGKALVRTLLFLPMTANLVAMAVVFRWIFAYQGGFVNQMLALVGVGAVNWLGREETSLITVMLVGIWRAASFAMMIFFAGLSTIPTAIDEVTAAEGVRGLTKLRTVTIPIMKPTVVFATVVTILGSVQVFDTINVMTQGGPQHASETILITTWRFGFGYFDLGSASALSFILLVVLIGLGVLQRRLLIGGER